MDQSMWDDIDSLMHYGTKRHSGRYPWGSGKEPFQHGTDFLARVDELKKSGLSENEIAKTLGMTTTDLRMQYGVAKDERRSLQVARAESLKADGYNTSEIARMMGFANESSVRSLLETNSKVRMNQAKVAADFIRQQINEKGIIDVGVGVERELGISKEKMKEALFILQTEGYEIYGAGIPQATNPGKQTNVKVICPPGTEYKDVYDFSKINTLYDYKIDVDQNGEDYVRQKIVYPKSFDSKRLQIRYAEEGGLQKDGVIELRRGVEDISLDGSHYAQVRILVDGTHYMKGMAIYSDDLPDGVDIRFNTNKKVGTPMTDVLKKIKDDPDNPFGSLLRKEYGQSYYYDENGEQQLRVINKTRHEGDWESWSDNLPSQFLSKQNQSLIDRQLNISKQDRQDEYNSIMELTNPTLKKAMLQTFAEDCDSAAVHLKAAALPRQKYQVILPLTKIKETEIYAPNYEDGEQVALIRYPHGGIFEIPILTVNNKLKEGKSILGNNPKDAVGISSKVAERLSGADFDGDTVMVIPTGKNVNIRSKPALKELEGFDTKMAYGWDTKSEDADGKTHYYRNGKEYSLMGKALTQTEMGKASNLITDMTIKGAKDEELARAVKHSMVVIDAEKHHLDYKQSYIDNGIQELKERYQAKDDGGKAGGASTLISKAKSTERVLKRKGQPKIDPETGNLIYNEVEEVYTDKNGKQQFRTIKSTKMAETKDARTLISDYDTPVERAYADYANKLKHLANEARKQILITKDMPYDPRAKGVYEEEVKSLNAKLDLSLRNAPRERAAQEIANSVVKAKKLDNPNMSKADLKKEQQRALTDARTQVGASRHEIEITDREWEAIQSGAVSANKQREIFKYADSDKLRERAMPRAKGTLSEAQISKIQRMQDSGYTNEQIAKAVGCSSSTVTKYLN